MKLYLATGNAGKIAEINAQLASIEQAAIELVSLDRLENAQRERYAPVEDGSNYLQNAYIKARALYDIVRAPVVAEDSGLSVDALAGQPGIHSARWGATDAERIAKLQEQLGGLGIERPRARFVACVCYLAADGDAIFFNGQVAGEILPHPVGERGFGYDPVFFYPPTRLTFAQMEMADKYAISHRGEAFRRFFAYLARQR